MDEPRADERWAGWSDLGDGVRARLFRFDDSPPHGLTLSFGDGCTAALFFADSPVAAPVAWRLASAEPLTLEGEEIRCQSATGNSAHRHYGRITGGRWYATRTEGDQPAG